MWLFTSFIVVILGGINWFLIGLLQYDFVAGMFGFQASMFSRIVYIAVGIATVYLLFKAIISKGKLNLFSFNFRKQKRQKEIEATKEESESQTEELDF